MLCYEHSQKGNVLWAFTKRQRITTNCPSLACSVQQASQWFTLSKVKPLSTSTRTCSYATEQNNFRRLSGLGLLQVSRSWRDFPPWQFYRFFRHWRRVAQRSIQSLATRRSIHMQDHLIPFALWQLNSVFVNQDQLSSMKFTEKTSEPEQFIVH